MSRPGIEPVTSQSPERTIYRLNYRGRFENTKVMFLLFISRYTLMSGGNESSDPWGVREEPEEIHGLGNMEIRQQQQHVLRGLCTCWITSWNNISCIPDRNSSMTDQCKEMSSYIRRCKTAPVHVVRVSFWHYDINLTSFSTKRRHIMVWF